VIKVNIRHGDLDTAREVHALQAVRKAARPYYRREVGTNDTTSFELEVAGLHPVLDAVCAHRRRWWEVTVTPPPGHAGWHAGSPW